ncbi:MAG: FAD-dependent oxidoreductase [Thermodesulfobacteriota bacterium]
MEKIIRDAVIVGGGIGGLVTACYLIKAGQKVSLIEAETEPGGLCRTIRKDNLTWNTSLYSLRGCQPGGPFHEILSELDLDDEITFIHSKRSYLIILDGISFPITTEIDEILTAADKLQGNGAKKIKPLLERILQFNPVQDFPDLSGKTFHDVAQAHGICDLLLNALAAPFMISLGLPPKRTSAFFAFLKYQLLLKEGVSYPRGGAGHLVNKLADEFTSSGGELLLGQKVNEITEEPNGLKKVKTVGGLKRRGRHLVINGDATWTMGMLGGGLPAKYHKKTERLTPSLSARLLFLAASKRNLAALHLNRYPHVIYLRNPDLDEVYNRIRKGGTDASSEVFGLTSPATWNFQEASGEIQPLTAFFPYSLDRKNSGPSTDSLLKTIHVTSPKLSGDLSLKIALNPEDIFRHTSNRAGSFCGWEMSPERYGPDRIPHRLSRRGIFLAGHWTDPGPSILNCALSGRKAAMSVLKSR